MKKFAESAYSESRGFPVISPILKHWVQIQRDYIAAFSGRDHPWHYRERTHIGFLSGAAWRAKAVTLEEWQTEKGTKAKQRKGRSDLYLYLRPRRLHLYVEAKHIFRPATGNLDKEMIHIERALTRATDAAAELTCSPRQKLGVLFLAPYFPAGRHHGMAARLTQWLRRVYTDIPHSSIAWLTHNRDTLRPRRGNFTAGIVLLARRPKHRTTH